MESISTESLNDSLSERELQRIARMEMSVALDIYLKRKRAFSSVTESVVRSTTSSLSTCGEKGESSKGGESAHVSMESAVLKEPLRTYDEALSNVYDYYGFEIERCSFRIKWRS